MATDPICGMWVEERESSLHLRRDNRTYYFCSDTCLHTFAEPERAKGRLRWRLAVAWPLAVLVAVLTYGDFLGSTIVVAAAAATVVQFYPGLTFYAGTWDALRDRAWNMDLLIAVGTTAAYGYSVGVLLAPGALPHDYYFDASSLIIALILSGNYLEQLTRGRANSAVRGLAGLLPRSVTIVREGAESSVALDQVRVGETVCVRPGERFSVDGTVTAGRTSADESILTGEPMPVAKAPGDRVIAGSLNGEGRVYVRVGRIGGDTFLSTVGRLLTEAEMARVPLQRTADRIAAGFVPTVLLLAIAAAGLWASVGHAPFPTALLVFVTVVITACPCAFGIATPAAILVGAGRAAEEGILFRGEDSIERAAGINVVVTDKTGTITAGRPTLVGVRTAPGTTETELLDLAASVESGSEHPLAGAVVTAARARGWTGAAADEVRAMPGSGVRGTVGGRSVELVRSSHRPRVPRDGLPGEELGEETSESVVRVDGREIGRLAFEDPLRPGTRAAVETLRAAGVRVVMATGDREASARAIARAAGIEEVHAGLTPGEKLELLERLRSEGLRVAFVGDGINDGPALAGADLGIAIGTGTDVAREAGGVLLVRPDFGGVPAALGIARRTVGKVRTNLEWAVGYNAVLIPIAMGAIVPIFGLGVYSVLPMVGAVAMGLSSTTVVVNSLSLRWSGRRSPSPSGAVAAVPASV